MILIDYRQIPRLNSFLFVLMATLASHLDNASHLFPCLVESMYFPGLKFDIIISIVIKGILKACPHGGICDPKKHMK